VKALYGWLDTFNADVVTSRTEAEKRVAGGNCLIPLYKGAGITRGRQGKFAMCHELYDALRTVIGGLPEPVNVTRTVITLDARDAVPTVEVTSTPFLCDGFAVREGAPAVKVFEVVERGCRYVEVGKQWQYLEHHEVGNGVSAGVAVWRNEMIEGRVPLDERPVFAREIEDTDRDLAVK
jgi:hypothetical protein